MVGTILKWIILVLVLLVILLTYIGSGLVVFVVPVLLGFCLLLALYIGIKGFYQFRRKKDGI